MHTVDLDLNVRFSPPMDEWQQFRLRRRIDLKPEPYSGFAIRTREFEDCTALEDFTYELRDVV